MGNILQKKEKELSVSLILKKLEDCKIPREKDLVISYLEMLEAKFEGNFISDSSKNFEECNGIRILLDIMNKLIIDPIVCQIILLIFEHQKKRNSIILGFMEFGGIDILERLKVGYENDAYILNITKKLLKYIVVVGSKQAIKEIQRENSSLQICYCCQEKLEKSRRMQYCIDEIKVPLPTDRVNRVCMFMLNYLDRVEVVTHGLDAIITFVENADAKKFINDTNIIYVVGKVLTKHKDASGVVWRCGIILSKSASIHEQLALEILAMDILELIIENYPNMKKDPRIQQQLIWSINGCLEWPRSKKKIQTSVNCMEFLNKLVYQRQRLLKEFEITAAGKFLPFQVILPVTLRRFMRETGGVVLPLPPVVTEETKKMKKIPAADAAKPKPIFGTVSTTIFTEGQQGLVDQVEEFKALSKRSKRSIK